MLSTLMRLDVEKFCSDIFYCYFITAITVAVKTTSGVCIKQLWHHPTVNCCELNLYDCTGLPACTMLFIMANNILFFIFMTPQTIASLCAHHMHSGNAPNQSIRSELFCMYVYWLTVVDNMWTTMYYRLNNVVLLVIHAEYSLQLAAQQVCISITSRKMHRL